MTFDNALPVQRAKSLYLRECCGMIAGILDEMQRLRRFKDSVEARAGFDPNEPVSNPQASRALGILISDIARLSRLLSQPAPAKANYRLMSEIRVAYFKELFDGIVINEVHSKAARNAFEHFEERVDNVMYDELEVVSQQSEAADRSHYFYSLLVYHRHFFPLKGRQHFLKVLVLSDLTYINVGAEIDLGAVESEATAMRERIVERLGMDTYSSNVDTGLAFLP